MRSQMRRLLSVLIACGLLIIPNPSAASTIKVTIKYPETKLDASFFTDKEKRVFGINWYSCQDQLPSTCMTGQCPGGEALFGDKGERTIEWSSTDKNWLTN